MYEVGIQRRARRGLAPLPEADYRRIMAAITALADEPRPAGAIKLTGRDAWRIAIGVYRVIYEINDTEHTVTVTNAGHRRDVYR